MSPNLYCVCDPKGNYTLVEWDALAKVVLCLDAHLCNMLGKNTYIDALILLSFKQMHFIGSKLEVGVF